ncbi:serine/threonine-protein kinase [Nocardia vulneris]|uniref:serine/threonine-protein kinase n=1 Tax=Nocardia vulneris TaxID=1141657 RepID=UPI00068C0ADF|nr:serine/threonine-protein kinase [Nocardia vulneris]
MLQTGEVFAGYVIRRVLGQGGMGTVYLAQHPRLPRLTALKLLKRELYTELEIRRRFEREADLAAGLDHPNIVTVFDRGAQDQQLWISMQYVPGADASCADVNVLEPERAVQIVGATANALDFAHANRVLHRDVKPANILLTKAPIGQHERVLLTDFGIASVRGSDTTLGSSGSITATLAFGAPEQLMGRPLDDRADQYSLACTLFWMLTGAPPYPGTNPAAVVHSHLHAPVPMLSRIRPGLPPALDRVLARALAKSPAARYPSCAEFAAAAGHALAAAPHPPPYPHNAPPPAATRPLPSHAAAWSTPSHPPQHTAPSRQPMHSDRTADVPSNGTTTPATVPPHAPDRSPRSLPHSGVSSPGRPDATAMPSPHAHAVPPPVPPRSAPAVPNQPHATWHSRPTPPQPPHAPPSQGAPSQPAPQPQPTPPPPPPPHPAPQNPQSPLQPAPPPRSVPQNPQSPPQPALPPRSAPQNPQSPPQPALPPRSAPQNPQSPPQSPPPSPPATTPPAETSGERSDRTPSEQPPGGPSGNGGSAARAPRIPRSVPPQPFPAPRRPMRRGTIELPDLPRRPGSAGRTQAPPPESRPPPIAISYRISLVPTGFRRTADGPATTAMVSMFSVVRPVPDRAYLCCTPVRRWVPARGGKWSRHAGQR